MLDEIRQERIKKIRRLKDAGINPFPLEIFRDFTIADAIKSFSKISKRKNQICLAGRIMSIRSHGGSIFCDFNDGSGTFQAFFKKDVLGKLFSLFEEAADIGDFVELKGNLFLTKRKEKTIQVSSWRVISKGISPLPEKWHGLTDIEERGRKSIGMGTTPS